MRKRFTISILVILLAAWAALHVGCIMHTVPLSECSDIYRRYAHATGIDASYVKDYHLNDSISVSVTLLHATDTAAWNTLLMDSLLAGLSQEDKASFLEHTGMWMKMAPRGVLGGSPAAGEDVNDVIVTDIENCTMAIFHTDEEELCRAIIKYYYKKKHIKKNNKQLTS